ncbi:MAG: nuclear transport factor 2 family protein [Balneolaceae bacterium]|nr:nuclear transport factor 2 family protein [Balneolaceae bacterium]
MTKKEAFVKRINEAFANNDVETIIGHMTDDIRWEIIGDTTLEGKDEVEDGLREMAHDDPLELTVKNIITHGYTAAVDGTMKVPGTGEVYAFCDVYQFRGAKTQTIKEMTSYVIKVKGA